MFIINLLIVDDEEHDLSFEHLTQVRYVVDAHIFCVTTLFMWIAVTFLSKDSVVVGSGVCGNVTQCVAFKCNLLIKCFCKHV